MLATAFAGLIAAGITSRMEGVGGKKAWEWLFIIEGAMTVVIAILVLPLMTDYPLQSKHVFLSQDIQLLAVSIHIFSGFCCCIMLTYSCRNGVSVRKMPVSLMKTLSLSSGDLNKPLLIPSCTCLLLCRWHLSLPNLSTTSSPRLSAHLDTM